MFNTSSRWITPVLLGALFAGDASAQLAGTGSGRSKIDTPNVAFGGSIDVIDFENKQTGEKVSQVFSAGGLGPVLVEGSTPSLGAVNSAIIFDSSNPTGGDFDLGSPNVDFGGPGMGTGGGLGDPFPNTFALEKILILADNLDDFDNDGFIDVPDDAAESNQSVTFDFSAIGLVNIRSITVIDFEPSEGLETANFFGPGGVLLASQNLGNPGDNGVQVSNFSVVGVERLVIEINGSGGIDAIIFAPDCNANGVPDTTDISSGTSADCNNNGIPDECDIASGTSEDCDANGVPDECQPDCDGDGIPDACDDPADCFERLCAVRAVPDDCATGILATATLGIGGNFTFMPDGEFTEFFDGTATLKGIVRSTTNPSAQFDICIDFSGLVEPGSPVPAGSPKQELNPTCYGPGMVDTTTWRYYTTWGGTATGLGSLDGAALQLDGVGPAFQVGEGANNKNVNFGASGWLTVTTTSQPTSGPMLPTAVTGDINVDLVDCPPTTPPVGLK